MLKIKANLSEASLDNAIKRIERYRDQTERKTRELCRRLAEIGATKVTLEYARAFYTGPMDVSVHVENRGDNKYAIVAKGETVLVVEFGAGVRYGDGHPQAAQFGMGPGTHPNKHYGYDSSGNRVANWENDRGWWTPKEKGGEHTFGNPPSMAMYNTGKDLRGEIQRIAEEVFGS